MNEDFEHALGKVHSTSLKVLSANRALSFALVQDTNNDVMYLWDLKKSYVYRLTFRSYVLHSIFRVSD
jgi:hypothetical protein